MADNGEGSSRPPPARHSRVVEAQPPRIPFPRISSPPVPRPEDVLPDILEQRPEIYPGSAWPGWRLRAPFGPRRNLPQYEMHGWCTHRIMVRRFVDNGILCPNCARQPLLGWLFLCVDDLDRPNGGGLSPGISRAMMAGHYTFRERTIVRQQRAIVLQHLEQESGPVAAPFSHIEVIQGVEPADEEDDNGNDEAPTESIEGIRGQNQVESMAFPAELPRRPACRFWCCYHCFDRSFERAFIHLDSFLNDPGTAITLPWELSNKRVSDARVVRNLDNHYKQREQFFGPPAPPYTSSESTHLALEQPHLGPLLGRLCRVASRIDLRAVWDPLEARHFSSAGLIAELSDSGSGHSFLSGGSRSILMAYAEENAIEPAEARSPRERESDLDVEVDDDDYGLGLLFRSTTLDVCHPE